MNTMRNLFAIVIFCGLSIGAYGQDTANLKVVIKTFDHEDGTLKVALYNASESWLKKSFKEAKANIENTEEVVIHFTSIPKGEYAISLYHDANDNDDLDANFFGIPTEDYAFSNNAQGSFGPAKYEDAVFTVSENDTIHTINLN